MPHILSKSRLPNLSSFLKGKRKLSKYHTESLLFTSEPDNYAPKLTSKLLKSQIEKRCKIEQEYIDLLRAEGNHAVANLKTKELKEFIDMVGSVEMRII